MCGLVTSYKIVLKTFFTKKELTCLCYLKVLLYAYGEIRVQLYAIVRATHDQNYLKKAST